MNQKLSLASVLLILIGTLGAIGCNKSSLKLPFAGSSIMTPEPTKHSEHSGWHDSFESALAESRSTGKPILADFTGSDWCHWCVKLREDVFETGTFKEWSRDKVVLLELDYPKRAPQALDIKQQNQDLAERYKISSYPTVLFLDPNGEVMGKLGYTKDPSEWIAQADTILAVGH